MIIFLIFRIFPSTMINKLFFGLMLFPSWQFFIQDSWWQKHRCTILWLWVVNQSGRWSHDWSIGHCPRSVILNFNLNHCRLGVCRSPGQDSNTNDHGGKHWHKRHEHHRCFDPGWRQGAIQESVCLRKCSWHVQLVDSCNSSRFRDFEMKFFI